MGNVKYDLSVVIACYNEEPLLKQSVDTIFEVLDQTRYSYELIFVDDCSRDRTREIIDEIVKSYPQRPIQKLFHEVNKGRGGTVTDGFRMAGGDVVGYVDIDLEVHARYIPSCVQAVRNGHDVATALRTYKFYLRSLDRYVLSRGYTWLMRKLLGVPLQDTETGFKFFKRDRLLPVLDEIEDQRWFWDTEVMVRSYLKGYRIVEIPCLFLRRFDKVSSVNAIGDSIDYFRRLWRFRRNVRGMQRADASP